MITLFNNDKNLYRTEKEFYTKSLEFAKKLPDSSDENLNFHLFWRVPGEFEFKQVSVIKSIIVNHSHKLDKLRINLWSNVDLSGNKFFSQVSKYVNLKIWNVSEEIKGTILENCPFLNNKSEIDDNLCYLEGDLFRLLILHKYGGFYIDMDVLVLRDLSPLNSYEFLYQWGPTGFKCFHSNTQSEMKMNGAIMRLNKNSDLSLEFLEILSRTNPIKNTTCWGSSMYSLASKNPVLVLPCIWFNSEWGYEGTENCLGFSKQEIPCMFDGAFTWHWHNRWDSKIEEGSKFDIIQKLHESKFIKLK